MKESKADRFVRVAEARVNKLIKMIRLLGNCSNRVTYDYRAEQVEQVFIALTSELNTARSRFSYDGKFNRKRFSLSAAEDQSRAVEHPFVEIKLPDGITLRAVAYANDEYPCISIYTVDPEDQLHLICFAEHNPNRALGHQLCIGAYQSHQDDTTYYEPYEAERNENE